MPRLSLVITCFLIACYSFVLPITAQDAPPDPDCSGAVLPRLIIGDLGRVLPGDSNNMRDAPSTDGNRVGSIPGSAEFVVLDGPVCANSFNWWQVDYDGLVGWTVEGASTAYWVGPIITESETTEVIEPVLDNPYRNPEHVVGNRLAVDVEVRLQSPDDTDLNLYESADTSSPIVAELPINTLAFLREEGTNGWWRIETEDGQGGWLQDGVWITYLNRERFFPTLAPVCNRTEGRVVFTAYDSETDWNLYTTQDNGNWRCNLTYGIFNQPLLYHWTANGDALIVSGLTFKTSPEGIYTLYAISADGRHAHRLIDNHNKIVDFDISHTAVDLPIALISKTNRNDLSLQLILMNTDGTEQRTLGEINGEIIEWSPDGTKLAYAITQPYARYHPCVDSQVRIVDIASGEETVALSTDCNILNIQWHPDGSQLLVNHLQGGVGYIKTVDVETLEVNTLVSPANHNGSVIPYQGVTYNHDGTAIAYWIAYLDGQAPHLPRELWVYDTETGEERRVWSMPNLYVNYIEWTADNTSVLIYSDGVMRIDINTGERIGLFIGEAERAIPQPTTSD